MPDAPKKKLIISADDYGVVPSIDQGIEDAAAEGLINSTNILTNYVKNGENLSAIKGKKLQDKAKANGWKLAIGAHLTLTSGQPLTNIDPECRHIVQKRINPHTGKEDRYFLDYDEIGCPYDTDEADQLKAELEVEIQAQIDALVDAGIQLDYISDHFGIFSFYAPFYEAYLNVTKRPVKMPDGSKKVLPIRSFDLYPKLQTGAFARLGMAVKHLDDLHRETSMEFLKNYEDERIQRAESLGFTTPCRLDMSHYKPALNKVKSMKERTRQRKKKSKNLKKALADFQGFDGHTRAEFIVHIRELRYPWSDVEKYAHEIPGGPDAYPGVNYKVFGNRSTEFASLRWCKKEGYYDAFDFNDPWVF